MRFLMDQKSYAEMMTRKDHTEDCYVRPGQFLHHMYVDGVKYVIARALVECLREAQETQDADAYRHLMLHKKQLDFLMARAKQSGSDINSLRVLGDPPPQDEGSTHIGKTYIPPLPTTLEQTGLNRTFMFEMILRAVYNRGRPSGGEISQDLGLSYQVVGPILHEMRQKELLDVAGQKGIGDISYEYILKPPRGPQAVEDALRKTEYTGPAPVPFREFLKAVEAQTIKHMVVTRRNIRQAFADLIITDSVLNEIGPAINSADSIFLFGFPGNGKTSIAERITRLMGDDIYIPHAIEADGQIIKMFDPIVHVPAEKPKAQSQDNAFAFDNPFAQSEDAPSFDQRWIRIKRPTIVVGGELTLEMLDLTYNQYGKFYEAPLQMKSNNGIFMIDDFGRQQVRPMDLLNRWIVPLEKKYDYLSTITGTKLQIPFDVLLIFSTNLDPNQLADEAFLRRIKFKIEIRDPDESQWRQIWALVCKGKKVELDPKGLDYLLEKWYKPINRPLRMCQPRDILNQMISIAKYNMESVTFSPDLIDAACESYFVSLQERNFGAKVRLE
ncbi:MAG: ATPase AAA [Anaerolineales bacterium]